jgi:hypothetical protein
VIRLYVIVEGQTEESFVRNILAEVLWRSNVHPIPILLGKPGHKGGRTSYARVKRDILVQLKQQRGIYCHAYRKVIEGTQGAAAVGISPMREHCHHFREWLERLESLEPLD